MSWWEEEAKREEGEERERYEEEGEKEVEVGTQNTKGCC